MVSSLFGSNFNTALVLEDGDTLNLFKNKEIFDNTNTFDALIPVTNKKILDGLYVEDRVLEESMINMEIMLSIFL